MNRCYYSSHVLLLTCVTVKIKKTQSHPKDHHVKVQALGGQFRHILPIRLLTGIKELGLELIDWILLFMLVVHRAMAEEAWRHVRTAFGICISHVNISLQPVRPCTNPWSQSPVLGLNTRSRGRSSLVKDLRTAGKKNCDGTIWIWQPRSLKLSENSSFSRAFPLEKRVIISRMSPSLAPRHRQQWAWSHSSLYLMLYNLFVIMFIKKYLF